MQRSLIVVVLALAANTFADKPTSRPAVNDATLDWLMEKKSVTPTTAPSTSESTPFKTEDDGTRPGKIVMNDGTTIKGKIATTADKPIRIWVEAEKDYEDVPFNLISSIEAIVVWERDEKEWHFKASGSDVKEFSGKTYPARETSYKVTLVNGQTIEGGIVAPLYVTVGDANKTIVLHKRDKGEIGQALEKLVYVKSVLFEKPG